MKKLILVVLLLLSVIVKAQVTNWSASGTLYNVTNYDFDLNTYTGQSVRTTCSFKIDIDNDGHGKVYLLDKASMGGEGQKMVYKVDYAQKGTYTDGTSYIDIKGDNGYAIHTIRISLQNKRGKEQVIRIAIINKNNEGSLYY
jgi:hypothetical protein